MLCSGNQKLLSVPSPHAIDKRVSVGAGVIWKSRTVQRACDPMAHRLPAASTASFPARSSGMQRSVSLKVFNDTTFTPASSARYTRLDASSMASPVMGIAVLGSQFPGIRGPRGSHRHVCCVEFHPRLGSIVAVIASNQRVSNARRDHWQLGDGRDFRSRNDLGHARSTAKIPVSTGARHMDSACGMDGMVARNPRSSAGTTLRPSRAVRESIIGVQCCYPSDQRGREKNAAQAFHRRQHAGPRPHGHHVAEAGSRERGEAEPEKVEPAG